MADIRYYGSKERGYTATRGSAQAEARRVGSRWEGSYAGSPWIHNPWVPLPGGGRSRSCMCPKIVVGTFSTRKEAAVAALDKKLEEERQDRLLPPKRV